MKHPRILAAVALLASAAAAPAPAQTSDNATLQALVSEVHQLRLAIEKSVSLGPRMQLILERAQLQDQKVARISQQLDDVRKRIGDESVRQTQANERLVKVEESLSSETDPHRRNELKEVQVILKAEAAAGPDQQLAARESELANSLRTEQAILGELDGKLDAIERQLEALPAAGDSPAAKPR
jgi:chromosome segregation ATPase